MPHFKNVLNIFKKLSRSVLREKVLRKTLRNSQEQIDVRVCFMITLTATLLKTHSGTDVPVKFEKIFKTHFS